MNAFIFSFYFIIIQYTDLYTCYVTTWRKAQELWILLQSTLNTNICIDTMIAIPDLLLWFAKHAPAPLKDWNQTSCFCLYTFACRIHKHKWAEISVSKLWVNILTFHLGHVHPQTGLLFRAGSKWHKIPSQVFLSIDCHHRIKTQDAQCKFRITNRSNPLFMQTPHIQRFCCFQHGALLLRGERADQHQNSSKEEKQEEPLKQRGSKKVFKVEKWIG